MCAFPQTETFRFERLWPALQQPWNFRDPARIAVDGDGKLYLADLGNNRIVKLNSDGLFITAWGRVGSAPGRFSRPAGVAVDADGVVFVADSNNDRIQRFSPDGAFEATWGETGFGDGQFVGPEGMSFDAAGDLYVVDSINSRIQKFNADGEFLDSWGTAGFDEGQFVSPKGLAIAPDGTVYVVDSFSGRIQRFTSDGVYILGWDGSGEGQTFSGPLDVAVDNDGRVYVADTDNGLVRIYDENGGFLFQIEDPGDAGVNDWQPAGIAVMDGQNIFVVDQFTESICKFTIDGQFLNRWGYRGSQTGLFNVPGGVSLGPSGAVFVADTENQRVQRFSSEGVYELQWGERGDEAGEFLLPFAIAVSTGGDVYVADYDANCVHKYTTAGVFVTRWGTPGDQAGEFAGPSGVATDSAGNVYVADTLNDRIQKFTADGDYIDEWGGFGDAPGELNEPVALAVGPGDRVYVADTENNRVQEFTAAGEFVAAWGTSGNSAGQFGLPKGIAVDGSGRVYVADTNNNRIQVFSAAGDFVTLFGREGTNPGDMVRPAGLAVGGGGRVFVADQFNDRIQVFRPVALASDSRAVVVAAGGPFPGNRLWDATQFCANYAYRALIYQGYTKDSIYYLSSDVDLDLDGNGVPDDVDADATNANLEMALTDWARGAGSLVLYLVDHGGEKRFRMSGNEILDAAPLAQWLDDVEATISGNLTVIYEACQSGSFLEALSRPGRIVITSSEGTENAYFLNTGTISFSSFFWTQVFNGASVAEAYASSSSAVTEAINIQTPQLDDNGNQLGNDDTDGQIAATTFIGNAAQQTNNSAPLIGAVSPAQVLDQGGAASFFADVSDMEGVARVWGVVSPPAFQPPSPDNPILDLPSFDFAPPVSGLRWESTASLFSRAGLYTIAIYASDTAGNVSVPALTTVNVGTPLERRAVIVAGGGIGGDLWDAVRANTRFAYNALVDQGYRGDTIYFLTPEGGFDGTNALDNVEFALTEWVQDDTQDLVFYFAGPATSAGLLLNDGEAMPGDLLDLWLDTAQAAMPGAAVVLVDACGAGSLIPQLLPPDDRQRIVIGSAETGKPASFLRDGELSYSRFFWQQALNGATVWQSHKFAASSVGFTSKSESRQTPTVDDNGNGIPNEREEGQLARNYFLGSGVLLAGNTPTVGQASGPQTLNGRAWAEITASNIATTSEVSNVWAVITGPDAATTECGMNGQHLLRLASVADGVYFGVYNRFWAAGAYDIAVYAVDTAGELSNAARTEVTQESAVEVRLPSDIDGDGNVTAVDIQLVINAALNLTPGYFADVNIDGAEDAVDVQAVINAALGIGGNLP